MEEKLGFQEYVEKIYGIGGDDLTDEDWDCLYAEWEEYCETGKVNPSW